MFASALDFQHGVPYSKGLVYPRFGSPGIWVTLPHALDVARRADGTPDFHVDLVRLRQSTGGTLAGYGVVDFRVAPVLDLEAARSAVTGGVVSEGAFAGGWLRLLVREPGSDGSMTVLPPLRIASNGLGHMRLAAQLTAEGVALLKRALLDGAVLVEAWAEMEVSGVAPRQPLVVRLQALRLAEALAPAIRDGLVTRAAVVNVLARPELLGELPGQLDPFAVAEAVADRLRNLCAAHVPSPGADLTEWWRLDLGRGDTRLEWDLSEPVEAVRVHLLRFDPIGLVRAAVSGGGLDRLITERELPELDAGFVTMLVTANLPESRSTVLICGVDITAEPAPPHRMHTIRETVKLVAPTDRAELLLRFAPGERRSCSFDTFLFAASATGVNEWRAGRKAHPGGDLRLGVGDFAARWIPIGATDQLVTAGALTVTVRWGGKAQTVTLTGARRLDTFVVPPGAEPLEFAIALRSGARVLEARVAETDLRFLDLPMFAEDRRAHGGCCHRPRGRAGRHRARLRARVRSRRRRGHAVVHTCTLHSHLDMVRPLAVRAWVPVSAVPVRRPAPPLVRAAVCLCAAACERTGSARGRGLMNEPDATLIVDGIRLDASSADGRAWTYLPDRPSIELSGTGAPSLSIIDAGPVAFLQCTARVALNEPARARLLTRLQTIEPRAETLEAAPISVERVALEVKDGDAWVAVAESTSSGMPPWTAALAATLAPGPLAELKAAAGGEAGHARLRAWITLPGSVATSWRAESSASTRVETPGGSGTASYTTTTEQSSPGGAARAIELSGDISDELFSESGENR